MTTSDAGFVQTVLDELASIGPIDQRPYFGGLALVCDGRQFAFIMGTTLYLATNEHTRAAMRSSGSQPFEYLTRNGYRTVEAYYDTPQRVIDDRRLLVAWATAALATRKARVLSGSPGA